ncbi:MAG: 30S ribosomal protein S20 [bacterium]|nr:30S ribosomal protein S20 [bacterium]
MPVHKSVLKRVRQNEKRRMRNVAIKSTLKTLTKKVEGCIQKGDKEEAMEELKRLSSRLDKAVIKGVIHRNKANRKKSRMARKVNAMGKK